MYIYFVWGVVKNKVYDRNPHTVDELKEYMSEAFIEIDADQELCRAVCHSVVKMLEEYCKVEGHVEHI